MRCALDAALQMGRTRGRRCAVCPPNRGYMGQLRLLLWVTATGWRVVQTVYAPSHLGKITRSGPMPRIALRASPSRVLAEQDEVYSRPAPPPWGRKRGETHVEMRIMRLQNVVAVPAHQPSQRCVHDALHHGLSPTEGACHAPCPYPIGGTGDEPSTEG